MLFLYVSNAEYSYLNTAVLQFRESMTESSSTSIWYIKVIFWNKGTFPKAELITFTYRLI